MRPDKKLAGAARPDRRRRHARQRLHEGRPGQRRRRRASTPRRCSSTAPPTATRSTARSAVATLYSDAVTATSNPAVTPARRRHRRRPGGRVHLRPRALGRLHAPGQPGVGRPEARRPRAAEHPPGRPLLRRQGRRRPARLGRPGPLRRAAGRRAAAPAREPDHRDEPATRRRCRASGTCRAARRRRSS